MNEFAQLNKERTEVLRIHKVSPALQKEFVRRKSPTFARTLPIEDATPRPTKPHKPVYVIEATRVVRSFELLPDVPPPSPPADPSE